MGPLLREELMAGRNLAVTRNRPIWVYDPTTLELVNKGPFENRKSAASYLNIDISTIAKNLDSKKASRLKNKSYYFFSRETDLTKG